MSILVNTRDLLGFACHRHFRVDWVGLRLPSGMAWIVNRIAKKVAEDCVWQSIAEKSSGRINHGPSLKTKWIQVKYVRIESSLGKI